MHSEWNFKSACFYAIFSFFYNFLSNFLDSLKSAFVNAIPKSTHLYFYLVSKMRFRNWYLQIYFKMLFFEWYFLKKHFHMRFPYNFEICTFQKVLNCDSQMQFWNSAILNAIFKQTFLHFCTANHTLLNNISSVHDSFCCKNLNFINF